MCEPVSITMGVMAAVGVASGAMAAKDKAKAAGLAIGQQRAQQAEMIKQMNISNANSDLEAKDKLQQSFVKSSDINLQGVHNESIVRNAIGESMMTGHTMDRIMADLSGEEAKAQAENSENYNREYQSAYLGKLTTYENTKAQIAGMAPIQTPNRLAMALDVVGQGVKSGASAYVGAKGGGPTTSGQVLGGIKGGLGA